MSEVKDPKIKLFGKTIELPETSASDGIGEAVQSCDASIEDSSIQDPPCSSNSILEDNDFDGDAEDQELDKNPSGSKQDDAKEEDGAQSPLRSEEFKDSNTTSPLVENLKALTADSDAGALQSSKPEEDQGENGNSQDKTLKKPDKIIPCPRCNSMDTKFCYFNNYNVNQPRHFCKNCQRYWTAGGTMRNVPVGAGRRKNKNAASQFRHLTVPEALQSTRVDLPNGIHHPMLNPNGAVITFASDTSLCEPMASVLNISDKTARNGLHKPEELGMSVSHGSKENGDDNSSGSSTTAAISEDEEGKTGFPELLPNCHPFPPQVPCFPGAPWPYPWPSVQWSVPVSSPTFGPASFPFPFYSTPPPYWGCAVPGSWNVPWVIPPTAPNSGPNSPTLGKHSRDDDPVKPIVPEEEAPKERNSKNCLWVPKTLRIDDPGEAAKSSIWATLGIKNDRVDAVGGGGLFKPFQSQSKGDEKNQVTETSTVLQANPAALSRSLSFHESS